MCDQDAGVKAVAPAQPQLTIIKTDIPVPTGATTTGFDPSGWSSSVDVTFEFPNTDAGKAACDSANKSLPADGFKYEVGKPYQTTMDIDAIATNESTKTALQDPNMRTALKNIDGLLGLKQKMQEMKIANVNMLLGAVNAVVGLSNAICQQYAAYNQVQIQNRQMTMQEQNATCQRRLAEADMEMKMDMVEKQSDLATLKIESDQAVAKINADRDVAIAKAKYKADVERSVKREIQSAFSSYYYG